MVFTSLPVLHFVDSHVFLQATVRSEFAIYNRDFSTNACWKKAETVQVVWILVLECSSYRSFFSQWNPMVETQDLKPYVRMKYCVEDIMLSLKSCIVLVSDSGKVLNWIYSQWVKFDVTGVVRCDMLFSYYIYCRVNVYCIMNNKKP